MSNNFYSDEPLLDGGIPPPTMTVPTATAGTMSPPTMMNGG